MLVSDDRRAALVVMLMSASAVLHASDSPQDAFAKRWEGKSVMVRHPLYSLVYNERGKLGNTRSNRRDGLTVVTASGGMYFQFDGRQSRNDVVGRDPQRIVDAVAVEYQPDSLDARPYRRIEPLLLSRYDPGVELLVKNVRFDRDSVRLTFARPGGPESSDDTATSLTVKWPAPLSKSFSERDLVEDLIRRFVDFTTPRP
jgi:hypothetical protein